MLPSYPAKKVFMLSRFFWRFLAPLPYKKIPEIANPFNKATETIKKITKAYKALVKPIKNIN